MACLTVTQGQPCAVSGHKHIGPVCARRVYKGFDERVLWVWPMKWTCRAREWGEWDLTDWPPTINRIGYILWRA